MSRNRSKIYVDKSENEDILDTFNRDIEDKLDWLKPKSDGYEILGLNQTTSKDPNKKISGEAKLISPPKKFPEVFRDRDDEVKDGKDFDKTTEDASEGPSDGEEILLGDIVNDDDDNDIIEANDLEIMMTAEMKTNLETIQSQVLQFRAKYQQLLISSKEMEMKNSELNAHISSLEEENDMLQKALESKDLNNKNNVFNPNKEKYNRRYLSDQQRHEQNQRGEGIRRALLNAEDVGTVFDGKDVGGTGENNNNIFRGRGLFSSVYLFLTRYVPFKQTIAQVEASFGSAVASYFVFYRWMLINFLCLSIPVAIFTVIHIYTMALQDRSSKILTGDGYLPGYMLISSYDSSEKLTYTLLVLICAGILLSISLNKFIREDRLRRELDALERESDSFVFAKDVFMCWDNSVTVTKEVQDAYGMNTQNFVQKLQESVMKGQIKIRTRNELIRLYSRRVLGTILYIGLQTTAIACILYLTVRASVIRDTITKMNPNAEFISSFITPVAVLVINNFTPLILAYITVFELWDSGDMELNILLFRMYLSNTLNLLLQATSYALLADPTLWTRRYDNYRKAVEIPFQSGKYDCRLTQVANGLFSLVLSTFVVTIVVFYGNGYYNVIYAWILKSPWVRAEFYIASNMVSVLYFSGINLLMLPFAPLAILLTPIMFLIKIYFEKLTLLRYYIKPKKPWKAQKAGTVFTIFFLCTVTLVAVPAISFVLCGEGFAKSCKLQDHSLHLCAFGYQNVTSNSTCTLNPHSPYYDYFSSSACKRGYPACLCANGLACGPFKDDFTAFDPLRAVITKLYILNDIYVFFFQFSYGAWVIILLLFLILSVRRNRLKVQQVISADREKNMENTIQNLEAEKQKQERIIKKLKAIDNSSV